MLRISLWSMLVSISGRLSKIWCRVFLSLVLSLVGPCWALLSLVEPCWALLSLVSNLRHDLDFTWQFRYHPAVRFGCCWPLQIAPADVRRYGKTGEDVGLPRGQRQFEGSFGWGRHFSKLAQVFLISEGLSKCEAVKTYRWMFRIFPIPISWTWIHFKIRKTSQTSLPTFETWFAKPIVLKEAKCLCLLKAFGHALLDLCHQLHRSCTATRLQSRYWDVEYAAVRHLSDIFLPLF